MYRMHFTSTILPLSYWQDGCKIEEESVFKGGLTMAKDNKHHYSTPKKKSKRERRQKIIVYLMIISMVLSTLVAGASFFL